jgi:hypothetical protein
MRFGASLLMLVVGLGLTGCAASAVVRSNNGSNSQASGGTTMLDPPLSVPPGFNAPPLETPASTPPPAAAGDSAQPAATDSASLAPAAPVAPAAPQTPGEQAFLQAAGANDVDPNIRAQIDAASRAGIDPGFVDKLIFGPSTPTSASGAEIRRSQPGLLDSVF